MSKYVLFISYSEGNKKRNAFTVKNCTSLVSNKKNSNWSATRWGPQWKLCLKRHISAHHTNFRSFFDKSNPETEEHLLSYDI